MILYLALVDHVLKQLNGAFIARRFSALAVNARLDFGHFEEPRVKIFGGERRAVGVVRNAAAPAKTPSRFRHVFILFGWFGWFGLVGLVTGGH